MNKQDFIRMEKASQDTIDVKMVYIDMAGGDIVAGVWLSQIVYWHLPGQDGKSKLRVQKDGHLWIAKTRAEWYNECRLTARQTDRCRVLLEDRAGLIETAIYGFAGKPTLHVRLKWDAFLAAFDRALAGLTAEPISPNGEMPKPSNDAPVTSAGGNSPDGKVHYDVCALSNTESTSETTLTENEGAPAFAPPEALDVLSTAGFNVPGAGEDRDLLEHWVARALEDVPERATWEAVALAERGAQRNGYLDAYTFMRRLRFVHDREGVMRARAGGAP